MRLIGLTGGIATGKSSIASMLRGQGADVIDADLLARDVVRAGSPALDEITQEFGDTVRLSDGTLDRRALAAIVFADAQRRSRLEAIMHPPIRELMRERVAAALASDAKLVVAEIPLLFEHPRDIALEGVLLVDCAADIQLARVMERDDIDATEARRRIASQMTLEEKRTRATWIIENNGDLKRAAEHVERWWRDVVAPPVGR